MPYRARQYDPTLARFLQADTITTDGLNRYTYVRNSPLMGIDPTGHDMCPAGNGGCGGVRGQPGPYTLPDGSVIVMPGDTDGNGEVCEGNGMTPPCENPRRPEPSPFDPGTPASFEPKVDTFLHAVAPMNPVDCAVLWDGIGCEPHDSAVIPGFDPLKGKYHKLATCYLSYPLDCGRITEIGHYAKNQSREKFQKDLWPNLPEDERTKSSRLANAYRHVLWSAMLTAEFGPDIAYDILLSHELDHTAPADSIVDVMNNEVGILIGTRVDVNHSEQLEWWVNEALEGGYLVCKTAQSSAGPCSP